MSEQALEGLGLDTSEQLPDDDLDADMDSLDAESDPAEGDEVDVTFGDESDDDAQDDDEGETPVIRAMRKREREKDKELRRLTRELERVKQQPAAAAVQELPPKPTLESCAYDEDEQERQLDEWYLLKASIESAEQEQKQVVQKRLQSYAEQAKGLKARDFRDVEEEVAAVFDPTRQSILLDAADNPALLVYALGKNPAQLERLSKIQSLAKFAAELGKLEKELKVKPRSEKPAPIDTNLRSSAPVSGGSSKKLAQLEAEAERTGNRNKVIAYKRSLRK